MNLNLVLVSRKSQFIFSPYGSDGLTNLVFMENIVGTLVKYAHEGKYSPYLATKWTTDNDYKKWVFLFRNNLFDEDGKPLGPKGLAISLNIILRKSAKEFDVPVFSNLVGWTDFKNGTTKTLKGISYDEKSITFSFVKKERGLLEYLAMPYFGYYSQSDFNENGRWSDQKKIVSTGAYKVKEVSKDYITLSKRNKWFSHVQGSPSIVKVINSEYEKGIAQYKKATIFYKDVIDINIPEHLRLIKTAPTILFTIVLSPFRDFFKDPENRLLFYQKVIEFRKKYRLNSPNLSFNNDFYPSSPSSYIPRESKYKSFKISDNKKRVLVKKLVNAPKKTRDYIESMMQYIFNGTGIEIKFKSINKDGIDNYEKEVTNKEFDIGLTNVDIGEKIDDFIIRMMFCSKLGVCFPDPSGKICELTRNQEKNPLPLKVFAETFNKIHRDDASVIPLWHRSLTWPISKDIDLTNTDSTMGIPRFDLIKVTE